MSAPGKSAAARKTDDRLHWARTVLDAPAEEGDRMRGFLLRRLADEDFAIDSETRAAILTLSHGLSDDGIEVCPEEFQLHREQQLSEQIEEFAAAFFSLPCDERKQRWLSLRNREDLSAPQCVRLEGLALGLTVIPERFETSSHRVAKLAELVCELFVLAPPVRAQRWREERVRMQPEIEKWSAAAAQLRKQKSSIAALQPGVLEELIRLDPEKQRWATDLEVRTRNARADEAHREMVALVNSTQEREGWPTWLIAVIVMAAAGICSGIFGEKKEEQNTPEVPSFKLKPEDYRIPEWPELQPQPLPEDPWKLKTPITPVPKKTPVNPDAQLERIIRESGASKETRERLLRDFRDLRKQLEESRKSSSRSPTKYLPGSGNKTSPP